MATPFRISFSRLGTYGRMGNQLFQIASVLGMATYKADAVFPDWNYEKYFVKPLPHGEQVKNQVIEKHFNYYDWELTEDSDLLGYMQSEKYFAWIEDKIREQFTFKPEVIQSVKNKFPSLFEKEVILIQIRRTDYVGCPHYYQLPIEYFIQALTQHFPNYEDYNIVFISDDLAYAKVHFECLPNATFADIPDYEQMALATLCTHFIIANSSFGWWGAWLGEKPHSKIIHSGRLHAGKLLEKSNEQDYYPARWTEFKRDSYKIDIKDVTFTIPIYYDHVDRKANLDLSVCLLQTNFDTNIIIGEQGGTKFEYMGKWFKYMRFDMQYFHRTKMLNDMATASNTPYIANWDADVIIPPFQIYLTVKKLREGKDMVFPYDGRFARLPRVQWFKPIEKILDIGAIGDTEPKGKRGRPVPEGSVGGAVFFNKESFIDGGMENENMISFGPEDCERNDRFSILGFDKDRVGGCLYHIDHWCGPDSSTRNPFFNSNHLEKDKIHVMNSNELRLYVDTWLWRHKYTSNYYKRIGSGSVKSATEVYRELRKFIKFKIVIDIGCGIGEWNDNNANYFGVDYNIPKKSLMIGSKNYIDIDLEKDDSIRNKILWSTKIEKFDLCLCLEVSEHISEERSDILIETLCNLSDNVLFSAAIPDQGGTGHVNEQWQAWWTEKFIKNKFYPYKIDLRKVLFHNDNVEMWYKNNMILFTKKRFKIDYELNFVHPEMFTSCIQHYKNQIMQLQQV